MQKQHFAIACLAFTILLTSTNLVAAQIEGVGQCPNVTTVQDLDLSKYVGDWKVSKKYPAVAVPPTRCQTAAYELIDTDYILVHTTAINADNQNISSDGAGILVAPGKFVFIIDFGGATTELKYWIIGTNYVDYAVVYSCTDADSIYSAYVWILTRELNPSKEVIDAAEAVVAAQGLPTQPLVADNSVCE